MNVKIITGKPPRGDENKTINNTKMENITQIGNTREYNMQ